MGLFAGLYYNLRGLWFGLRHGKLLILGLIRLGAVILLTLVLAGLILVYHQDIMNLTWERPESHWVLWLWYVASWLLTLFLVGVAAVISYLISQVLFSVLIMDLMSRITEKALTGRITQPEGLSLWKLFIHLVRQEIPRTVMPLLILVFLMVLGWLTPLGPVITVVSSGIAVIFLAWDSTDLIQARRLLPFKKRFGFLVKTIPFHLGFGLPFLIPGLNILFLSFASVGAALYYIEKKSDL